jgi:hypothetical protein
MSDEYRGLVNSVSRQTLQRPNEEGIDGYSICHSCKKGKCMQSFCWGMLKEEDSLQDLDIVMLSTYLCKHY